MDDKNNDINRNELHKIYDAKLSDADFSRLSKFIQGEYGIKMPPEKKIMLQSRLQKRLRALGMVSYSDYVNYVFDGKNTEEIIHMIDVVSTNKTDFFREPVHFDYLKNKILPEFKSKASGNFNIWSAGCSSGAEPYTIAMVCEDFKRANNDFSYNIFATDISTRMLKKAINAIYPVSEIDVISLDLKKKYLLKSKNPNENVVRIVPELRQKLKFGRLNFMDDEYHVNQMFDLIFCRNVLIYFDRENQEKVINNLCKNLKPDGYFLLGHSESITGINVPLKHIQPTIFQKLK
jgi:chemotaxis protein methyltransferase CheR